MGFLGILELVIGLVFIYFIMGLACSAVREILANLMSYRAKNLEAWLMATFDEKLGSGILKHKLIDGLTTVNKKASYYPSRVFVNALLDLVNSEDGKGETYTIESVKEKIEASDLLPSEFKRTLLQSISESKGELERFKNDLGNWFDQAMLRISGIYKKHTQKALLLISFVVVFIFNVDSIALSKYFHDNPAQRKAMVEKIDRLVTDSFADMESYQLPLGWETEVFPRHKSSSGKLIWILSKISGLFLSTLLISIGAPFWYDVLNKLVRLRSAGALPYTKAQ